MRHRNWAADMFAALEDGCGPRAFGMGRHGEGGGRGPGGGRGGRGEGGPGGVGGGGGFGGGGFGRGGRGGGRGGGGPGAFFGQMADMVKMRAGRVLSSDDLQLVILSLVDEKPRHGYEIIKALEEQSSGIYKPSPGMIYPSLTYLEEADFVTASTEGAKKLISITDAGKAHLAESREHVDHILSRLKDYGEKMASFHEQANNAETWGEFHAIRRDLKDALMSKFGANAAEKKRVFDILKRAIDEIRNGK